MCSCISGGSNACDAAGVRYEFKKMKSGFVVCFYGSEEKADKKPIKADRKEQIVQYVKEHGSISNMEARELLGLADSTIKRLLKEMVEEKILVVEGERKARRYLPNVED